MTDEELRRVYQAAVATRQTGREDCPAPEALSSLVAREGNESNRLALLDHVMTCPACRHEFELLRAVHVAGRPRPAWRYQPLALAASIALLVGLGGAALWSRLMPSGPDTLRGGAGQVELVRPTAGSVVTPPLTLVWRTVSGTRIYTVELLAPDGRLVKSWTTADTSITLSNPASAHVPAGAYAWWVRARLPDGSERRSTVTRFELH
jgi:hypothetical protein